MPACEHIDLFYGAVPMTVPEWVGNWCEQTVCGQHTVAVPGELWDRCSNLPVIFVELSW